MRCTHCRCEIPPGAQFCVACGEGAGAGRSGANVGGGMDAGESLLELPVSPGTRAIRLLMVVAINLMLLAAGVTLFLRYLEARALVLAGGGSHSELVSSVPAHVEATASPGRALPGESAALLPERKIIASGLRGSQRSAGRTRHGANKSHSREEPSAPVSNPPSPTHNRGTASSLPSASFVGESGSVPVGSVPVGSVPVGSVPGRRGVQSSSSQDAVVVSSSVNVDTGVGPPGLSETSPTSTSEEERLHEIQVLSGKIGILVRRHRAQLGRCYKSALKQGRAQEPIQGRIRISFSVQPDGTAARIGVHSNDTGSPALGNCMVGLVASWTFPSSGSEAADFVWPFEFLAP